MLFERCLQPLIQGIAKKFTYQTPIRTHFWPQVTCGLLFCVVY